MTETDSRTVDRPARGLRRTFRSLTNPNYRLFFFGQGISVCGTWMQRVAQDWMILELGGGPLELAIGVGLQFVPLLLFGPWAGVLVDRSDVRRLLLYTQIIMAALAVALGALVVTGFITLPIVYLMALAMGLVAAIDTPSRHTFVFELVGPHDTANAVSLNASIVQTARLVGPAMAGVAIGLAGTGIAFFINAGTYVAIVVALLRMDKSSLYQREPVPRERGQVLQGLRHSWSEPSIRTTLIAVILVSTFAQNWRVVLPLISVSVFDRGSEGYGFLMSALGIGALGGALACAYIARPSLRMVGIQALGFGLVIVAAGFAPTFAIVAVLMIGVGAGHTSFNTTSNALSLLRAGSEFRGRVMALRGLLSNGVTPIGSLCIGAACEWFGPRVGLALGGVIAALTAIWILTMARWPGADAEAGGHRGVEEAVGDDASGQPGPITDTPA